MNKNYELLFKKDEIKGKELSQKYLEFIWAKIENIDNKFENNTNLYSEENLIFSTIINLCDANISETTKKSEISKFQYSDIIRDYDINKNGLINILTDNCSISAIRLSGNIKEISNIKYYSSKGNNYESLIMLSKNLKRDNKIVTGYIYNESDKIKQVHSWIEFKKAKKDYIIDYKNNLIMNKAGYYFLKHVEKINEISSNYLKEDEYLFNEFNQILNLKEQEYLTFRDEIMKDLEKNKQLIL